MGDVGSLAWCGRLSRAVDPPAGTERYYLIQYYLSMELDGTQSGPLYLRVAAELRRAVAEGEAKPGERLPPARDLAAVLGVNQNTMFRALRELRDEGILEFRRGRGITVAGTPERSLLLERVRDLLEYARHHGYRPAEVVELIETVAGAS